jgi:uncharacterized protein YyaL (SSP411 family)
MVETPRVWCAILGLVAASCAAPEPQVVEQPVPPPVAVAREPVTPPAPVVDEAKLAEEAKALLAQAETDIQRARAKRALWLQAWADLLSAREAMVASDSARVIRYARHASELAQLGLEQLAYPAVSAAARNEESK